METENVLIENLLKPRIKVIAPWPNMKEDYGVEVGDIVIIGEAVRYTSLRGGKWVPTNEFISEFNHLFKRLEWWQERQESEMPKYLKYVNNGLVFEPAYIIPECNLYYETDKDYLENNSYPLIPTLIPATEQEYTSYINQSKK